MGQFNNTKIIDLKNLKNQNYNGNHLSNFIDIIGGIDDTTKSPCIGSIFIAGVIADKQTIEEWKKLGVKDSKLITAKKREELNKVIKSSASGFVIQEITPKMIDDKILNLNDWEMLTVLAITQKLKRKSNFNKVNLREIYIDN
jgi:ribonuclease HII